MIILYFLHPERKTISPSTFIIRWNITAESTPAEVNLLDFKEDNDLPSWYPIFQLPYEIDVKVTCTGFHIYIEIIYIDSSPDPDIFAPYAYHEPHHEFLRHLYDDIDDTNYISDH